jgi:hypothetical protein
VGSRLADVPSDRTVVVLNPDVSPWPDAIYVALTEHRATEPYRAAPAMKAATM